MAQTGVVKFFNGERGYGFIKPDDGGRDVFVHITAVEQAGLKGLNEGQRISFDVEPDKKGKGPKAVNLVVTGSTKCTRSEDRSPGQTTGALHNFITNQNR
jgi:cold shock protein